MTDAVHVHTLDGCAPTPLAHYLKALGVLRLVSTVDPQARGFWRNQAFVLVTKLDRQALCDFFLHTYCPTPMVDPWNGDSGFYPNNTRTGIEAIANSTCRRLATYREAIELGAELVEGRKNAPKDETKTDFLRRMRQQASAELRAFLDAAFVLTADGEVRYPALLGSGGNDAHLDFINNFMQRLVDIFDMQGSCLIPRNSASRLLANALFGTLANLLPRSIGQFYPGHAGGHNASFGFSGKAQINPWDFVLMLEGTIVFRSSVARRSTVREPPQAAAPFAVQAEASGFASATHGDKNRGEQWMPLWDKPCTSKEMVQLFAEGRCQQGRGFATRPVEFARALAQLGVARGITAFERFGYIQRNGQNQFATPLGRWVVSEVPYQHLVDEIAPWVEGFRRLAADNHAPASFKSAARRCDEAVLACCRPDASHHAFSTLLITLGTSEALALRSPKFAAKKRMRPLPTLSPGWLEAAGVMRTCEGRLALALANLHGLRDNGFADSDDPLRKHWLPCVRKGRSWAFHVLGEHIHRSPHQVCAGRQLTNDLTAILQRRLVTRQPANRGSMGLTPAGRAYAELGDVTAFVEGATDDGHLLDLVRPLGALAWEKLRARPRAERAQVSTSPPTILPAYAVMALAHPLAPPHDADARDVRVEPSCLHRLLAGDLSGATRTALARLAVGGRLRVTTCMGNKNLARRLAAALLFPLGAHSRELLARRIYKPASNREHLLAPDSPLNPNEGHHVD